MRHRRIPYVLLSTLLAAGLALSACGDDDGSAESSAEIDAGVSVEDDEMDGDVGASTKERAIRSGLEAVDMEVEEVSVEDGEARIELSGDADDADVRVVCTAVTALADRVLVLVDGEETEC